MKFSTACNILCCVNLLRFVWELLIKACLLSCTLDWPRLDHCLVVLWFSFYGITIIFCILCSIFDMLLLPLRFSSCCRANHILQKLWGWKRDFLHNIKDLLQVWSRIRHNYRWRYMFTDIIFTGTGYVCHCCEEDVQAFLGRCQGKLTPQYCIGLFIRLWIVVYLKCTGVSKNVMGNLMTWSCQLGRAYMYFHHSQVYSRKPWPW